MFGSRSSSNSGKGTGYVAHNKVIVFEDKRYQYDAFGRLSEKRSSKHGLQTFAYDAEHRLIQVTKHESTGYKQTATQTTKFAYDALGRRTSKTHNTGDAYSPETKTTFSWDGLRLLSETTQTVRGDKTSLYIYADSESYEPLARVDTLDGKENTIDSIANKATNTPANDDFIDENGSNNPPKAKIFHFHNDLNGLPQELSTEGEFVWKATYKVWGNVATEEWTGEYQHAQQLGETQNLRFQGQYYDVETGLHFNTFRFYDPDIGRFTSTDPIGLEGGHNLFQYAPNPVGWVDPLGLETRPNNGKYNISHDHTVPAANRYSSDAVQFRGANKEFISKMNSDPAFRKDMLRRNPSLAEWMKTGNHSGSPAGHTWHHHEQTNRLVLVSRSDHASNHGLYHPTGKGGRDMWGGGKPGRTGKLNGATGGRC
jgi:RHS repeat-associated protein